MVLAREDQVAEEVRAAIAAANAAPYQIFSPALGTIARTHLVTSVIAEIDEVAPEVWVWPEAKVSSAQTRASGATPPTPAEPRPQKFSRDVVVGVLVARKLTGSAADAETQADELRRIRELIEERVIESVPRAGMVPIATEVDLTAEELFENTAVDGTVILATYRRGGLT